MVFPQNFIKPLFFHYFMERVLITGGAGFLGINLVRYLLNKGYIVRILDIEPFNYDIKDKVECIQGDVRNNEDVETAMKDVDYVVHCAAALPLYPKEVIMSTDYKGTEKCLEYAKKLNIKRFIHISTTAVYGIPKKHPIYETDPMEGVGPYGEAKVLAEHVCEEYRKKGMIVPILRPKSFIGPERLGVFAIYFEWIKDKKNIPIIGNGKNRYQLLDVEDLCDSIHLCMTKDEKKVNGAFNIGAKEFTTMKEDFGSVIEYAKTGKKVIGTPAFLVILALKFLEFMHLSPLYKWVYETADKDSFVSIEKAEKILGWHPKYSTKDALIRNYRWYIAHYDEIGKEGISHRTPWKQGALKFIKWFF